MKIKFETNVFTSNETTTNEMWLNAFEFGSNFNIKRIPAFIHYGVKKVECEGYKKLGSNAFVYQPLRETVAGMTFFIPEWLDSKRWKFIFKLCQVAESIEIDNLRVSEFSEWLEGKDVRGAMECTVFLNGANTGRSLNILFEQDCVQ